MTREEVVKLVIDVQFNPGFINPAVKADVILNYCVNNGKSPSLSIQFIQIISMNNLALHACFLDAVEALIKEHNINILYSKANYDSSRVLLIY